MKSRAKVLLVAALAGIPSIARAQTNVPPFAIQALAINSGIKARSGVGHEVFGIVSSGEVGGAQRSGTTYSGSTSALIWGDASVETIFKWPYDYWPNGQFSPSGGVRYYNLGIGEGRELVGYMDPGYPIVMSKAFTNGFSLLPTPANMGGIATAINPSGIIAGSVNSEACLWGPAGFQSSGLLQTGVSSTATAINRSNDVVGFMVPSWAQYNQTWPRPVNLGDATAFLWSGNKVQKLEQLVTSGTGWRLLTASAINDQGQIVGLGMKDGKTNGYIFQAGMVTDLGISGYDLQVSAINNRGEVVGSANHGTYDGRAFYWTNGMLYDLNTLIPADLYWVLTTAVGINDRGQIVGRASVPLSYQTVGYDIISTGGYAVYRLNPVVFPSLEISHATSIQNGMLQIRFFNSDTNWHFTLHTSIDLTNWSFADRSYPPPGIATFTQPLQTNAPVKFFRVMRNKP